LNIFWQLTQISKDKQHFIDGLPENYISPITRWEDKNNQVERWLNSSDNMSAHNQKTFSFLSTITKALSKSNIPILVGSDAGVLLSPHGLATHNELRLLREAGLSNFSVLRSATILPAKALGKPKEIGQVKVGFKADLILTTTDPTKELSILENPSVVIKNGHWLAKEELAQLQDHAIEQQSLWSELGVLIRNY
jgi:adenine deaminase